MQVANNTRCLYYILKEKRKQALVVVKVLTAQFLYTEKGSPRLILEGGHWCDECERKSWNYGMRARKDKFFAQVWNPLHDEDEIREYPKTVSELEV